MYTRASFAGVVVDEADRPVVPFLMLEELSRQHLACVSGAGNQHVLDGAAPAGEGRLCAEPRPELRHTHRQENQQGRDACHREWDVAGRQEHVDAEEEDRYETDRRGEAHRVGHAGIVPGRSVDAEKVVTHNVGEDDHGDHLAEEDHRFSRDRSVEPERERRRVAGDDEERVQGEDRNQTRDAPDER